MMRPPEFIRKRLQVKILLALTIGVAIVMAAVIILSVANQKRQIRERMTDFGSEMKSLAYAAIKNPMSRGDSSSIAQQLLDIKDQLRGAEIVIFDFNGLIVFATHAERLQTNAADITKQPVIKSALKELLNENSDGGEHFFEENTADGNFLITMHSIINDKECRHCHGDSRKILGGLLTRQETDTTYAAIESLRNRTIAISIVGICAIVALIYFLLLKLVTRPVAELAQKAGLLAAGDMSAAVKVKTEDVIGDLGRSFNFMVGSIKDQIEFANSLKDAIADPLFMVDTNLTLTYMNEACAQITGYSREEAIGNLTCRQIFQSEICDSACPVRRCFETGAPVEGVRTNITSKAGKSIPIMTSANALKDSQGVIVGAVEICKDISIVLEAEQLRFISQTAAREEEQRKYLEKRAKSLLRTLSEASEGNLKIRASLSENNGIMDEIANHANHMLDNLEKLYEKISSFSRELELEVSRRTMMLRERTLLLERANRELRELDRLKSSFLANMSHELRTPMNSIIGYTELLIDRVDGEINEEQEKSLIKVDNNAKHLLQLINDILDMSKIESGKMDLTISEVELREVLESVTSSFGPAMALKNISLNYNLAESLPHVFIDEDKVRQILLNLLSNAVKFTSKGSITIHAKPSKQGMIGDHEACFVEVCVEDSGIGIKKEDIGKLFDKFSQIDSSTIRRYEGTGLGLSIARGLVVLHKGVIWAESEFGKGTRLYFTLPARAEILAKPAKPIIEPLMAEKLGEYLNKPMETFLEQPIYGGKPIRCWEYTHCSQTSCPAYGSKEHRCWLIPGTHCKGIEVATGCRKAEFCKGCEIIEQLVIHEYERLEAEMAQGEKVIYADGQVKNILAIDDDPDVIELIKKNIGKEYNVFGLSTGKGAVDKAKELQPMAITLDIMMPEKDGWQVLQELKKDPATCDIPVIILSIVDEKRLGFSMGAAEYLVKPIGREELLRKLWNLEKRLRIQKILVVDPDSETVNRIASVLEEVGFLVIKGNNHRQTKELIKEQKPDLMVYNPLMVSDDCDILEYLATDETARNLPLILITHEELTEKEIRDFNGRVESILNKGLLSEEELLAKLKNMVEELRTSAS